MYKNYESRFLSNIFIKDKTLKNSLTRAMILTQNSIHWDKAQLLRFTGYDLSVVIHTVAYESQCLQHN